MVEIFVNGISAKSGGGKSILTNFLSLLHQHPTKDRYWFLTPSADAYRPFQCEHIRILDFPEIYNKTLLLPLVNCWILPKIVRNKSCDLVFNLADIPMPTPSTQIFLFDWSYAVFPDSYAWKVMDFKGWLIRKAKLFYFKKNLKYVDLMIAQTGLIKRRLEKIYDLEYVEVIPNAVSLDNLTGKFTHDFKLGDGVKLLYLTHYYTHKNIEIFLPLAEEILARGEKIRIIITISPEQHRKAKEFLQQVKRRGLQDIIHNVGPVAMNDVPSLYAQTDGLLMPTLLESFSGTYVEAMFHGKPIYTSDLDFAKDLCGDAAYYFDPLDYRNILDRILESLNDPEGRQLKIQRGRQVLRALPSWEQVFHSYMKVFEKSI
ncbi:MAG: glycosyltransferase [Sphingomonadales bacterium]|nr:glycosyltransferase [Sphingomonadales bacterium]